MAVIMNYRQLTTKVKFEPLAWRDALETGCYCYAINVKCDRFTLVGDILGKRCTEKTSDYLLIETLKEELTKIFKFEVKEASICDKTEKDEIKIFLEREVHTGFYHFYRQDKFRTWSEKMPGELPKKCNNFEKTISLRKQNLSFSTPKGWCFILKRKMSN